MKTTPVLLSEMIAKESRLIAATLIEAELEKSNLPLPRESAMTAHIDNLLASRPDIVKKAEERVNAKTDAYSETLRAIGIEPKVVTSMAIEL